MDDDDATGRDTVPASKGDDRSPTGAGLRHRLTNFDWDSDPLLNNGHALMASSIITSLLGMAFWVLAARRYDPAVVGRNSVALNALVFVGNIAQLGFSTSLMRFVPVAGNRTLRLVATTYLLCGTVAVGSAVGIFYVLPHLIPSLSFLTASHSLMVWWIVATTAWTTFVIEDGALTGLRQSRWVPVENAGFSIAKAALVLPLAIFLPKMGIFFAWTLATVITIIPTNVFLFGSAIPRAQRRATDSQLSFGQLARYVPYDYLSSIFWAFSVAAIPVLVIRRVGAAQSAYFNLAWVMSYVLYLSTINIGSSLIVESSLDQSKLARETRRVIAHLAKLVVPVVVVILLAAPEILELFGHSYAAQGAWTFRLLALSALPFIFNETVLSALRAQRRTRAFLLIEVAICLLAVLLAWLLLDLIGIEGAGAAWLISQSVVALVLFLRRHSLIGDSTPVPLGRPESLALRLFTPVRATLDSLGLWPASVPRQSDRRLARHVLATLLNAPVVMATKRRAPRPYHRLRVEATSPSSVSALVLRGGSPIALASISRDGVSRESFENDRRSRMSIRDLGGDAPFKQRVSELVLSAVGHRVVAIETAPEGIFAARLLESAPWTAARIASTAMESIERLHEATATVLDLDDTTADELLAAALSTLSEAHPFERLPHSETAAIGRLDEALRLAFAGKQLSMSTVHGAYAADAICISPNNFHVTNVINWHNSRPRDLPCVDILSLAMDITSRTSSRSVGVLVAGMLRDGTFPDGPLFATAARRLREVDAAPRDLLLWSWLAFVTGQLRMVGRGRHGASRWANDVAPVLSSLQP